MNNNIILLKYGEIVLKGLNKNYFNDLLLKRVRRSLKSVEGEFVFDYAQSTLCIRASENADVKTAYDKMKRVFGVASVSLGCECEKNMDAILSVVTENADELIGSAVSFKCEAKRSDKSFPLGSPQICAECGAAILEVMPQIRVDVNNPECVVTIEIRDKAAFIHGKAEKGAGGMPTGSNGRGVLLLSGGIDSPVAGYMIAKRGVEIDAVYFETPPYTGDPAREKVTALAQCLAEFCGQVNLHRISLTEIQQAIAENCEERLFTLILRRFMMRAAQELAKKYGAGALITGESVGQVASQTMEALAVTDNACDMPVYRPCIGLDKDEIVCLSRKIGTYDTSVLPYDDCCVMFTPKHPNTRPSVEAVLEEEKKLDVDGLLARAMETDDRIRLYAK